MTRIYALADPVTGEPRYVGKTSRPLKSRLACHLSNRQPSDVNMWIRGLDSCGAAPAILEIESGLGENEWPDAEQFWIGYFNFIGANLTNGHHNPTTPRKPNRRGHTSPLLAPRKKFAVPQKERSKLGKSARDLLDYLKVVMDKQNVAIAPVIEIQERIDLSTASIARAKAQLMEMDFIRQRAGGVYMVNPGHACKAAGDDRQAVYEAYSLLPHKTKTEKV